MASQLQGVREAEGCGVAGLVGAGDGRGDVFGFWQHIVSLGDENYRHDTGVKHSSASRLWLVGGGRRYAGVTTTRSKYRTSLLDHADEENYPPIN